MAKSNVLPLILLLLFVAVLAAVGFVVYSIVQGVSKTTREKMEKKNVVFTKDGMKVNVKEIKDEAYKDRTQRFVFFLLSFPPSDCLHANKLLVNHLVFLSICGTTLPSPPTRVAFGICRVKKRRVGPRSASRTSYYSPFFGFNVFFSVWLTRDLKVLKIIHSASRIWSKFWLVELSDSRLSSHLIEYLFTLHAAYSHLFFQFPSHSIYYLQTHFPIFFGLHIPSHDLLSGNAS